MDYLRKRQFAPFPTLESFLVEIDVSVDFEFLERVCNHLTIMKQKFETYFPNNFYEKFLWVRNPFQAYNHENDLSLSKKEQLLELSSDSMVLVRKRTIPIERSPLVSEASANFSG
jgi:hypothetical protein